MLFSSGGVNVTNNRFVGLGAVSNMEADVQQIVAVSGTATSLQCYVKTPPNTLPIQFT